jgi:hypothetical protein
MMVCCSRTVHKGTGLWEFVSRCSSLQSHQGALSATDTVLPAVIGLAALAILHVLLLFYSLNFVFYAVRVGGSKGSYIGFHPYLAPVIVVRCVISLG